MNESVCMCVHVCVYVGMHGHAHVCLQNKKRDLFFLSGFKLRV